MKKTLRRFLAPLLFAGAIAPASAQFNNPPQFNLTAAACALPQVLQALSSAGVGTCHQILLSELGGLGSGAALDTLAGFSSNGYIKRTGAGTYAFNANVPLAEIGNLGTGAALDTVSGITGTGYLRRNGAGLYAPVATIPATDLMYTVPWSGGTAIQQAIRNTRLPEITDFAGVDPLGLIDSTTGIQNAINATCSNGAGRLFAPAGQFLFTALALNCGGIDFTGAGELMTTLRRTSTTGNAITIGIAGTILPGDKLRNLSVLADTVTVISGANIYVQDTNFNHLDHLRVIYGVQCVQVENSNGSTNYQYGLYVTNSLISNCTNNFVSGTLGTSVAFPEDVFISRSQINSATSCGLNIYSGGGFHVDHTDMVGNSTTLCHIGGANQDLFEVDFDTDDFDTPSLTNINVSLNATAKMSAWRCLNCWVSNAQNGSNATFNGAGIDGVSFRGGTIITASQHGLVWNGASGAKNLTVDGVAICNNGTTSAGNGVGAYIQPGSKNFAFLNNTFGDCSTTKGGTNLQDYAINIDGAGSDYYTIAFNQIVNPFNPAHLIRDASNGANSATFANLPATIPNVINNPQTLNGAQTINGAITTPNLNGFLFAHAGTAWTASLQPSFGLSWLDATGTPTLSGCGTGASIVGGANSGAVTLGTGFQTNSSVCLVTFAAAFPTNAYCTVSAANSLSLANSIPTIQGTVGLRTSFSFSISNTATTGISGNVNYTCTGR